MTGSEFKAWRLKMGIKVADVMSQTQIHLNTLYRFERGGGLQPLYAQAIYNFVNQVEQKRAQKPTASG